MGDWDIAIGEETGILVYAKMTAAVVQDAR